ncbi:MAG: hypothetical protein JOY64_34560 [Alphaproteobacteria bacterium]|nr:hypothetical protein [Alphaproteobacteria bacterium]MBV8412790.1 hypothetical protein [Alphaproteobacteria bacterium]
MRRQITAGVFFVLAASGATASAGEFPYGSTLAFKVYRGGTEIGQHTVTFRNDGTRRLAKTSVQLAVKALGITAFRYSHEAREVWDGEALQQLESHTDENGKKYDVHIHRDGQGLVVDREVKSLMLAASASDQALVLPEKAHEVQPPTMLPTSNWNFEQVTQRVLLNTQYGTPSHTTITPMGRELVKTASGATIEATRYHYTGDLRMDQWFDAKGRWVRAAFPAFDGSIIEYVLQE